MRQVDAQKLIESLRTGIPPDGHVRTFTVGREHEIKKLQKRLESATPGALLLQANYGSGKTHLLRFVKEEALSRNYAVALASLDAKSAVRFNRMDQITGAICRAIEVPQCPGEKGIRTLLDQIAEHIDSHGRRRYWKDLTNNGEWDYSDRLESQALYIAIRAWYHGSDSTRDLVESWLEQPWEYRTDRRRIHREFIRNLRGSFQDPRSDWQFYADKVLEFVPAGGYAECWALLRDLHNLVQACGMEGFAIQFDEFEDIITNLNNIRYQEEAFWNLFKFYRGSSFGGMSFFAVTPEFRKKCVERLIEKNRWDYKFSQFENIPTFQMSPLETGELEELATRILNAHGIAYGWEPDLVMKAKDLDQIVRRASAQSIQDRARFTITRVVAALDDLLQESE